jgi:hypothetical protein
LIALTVVLAAPLLYVMVQGAAPANVTLIVADEPAHIEPPPLITAVAGQLQFCVPDTVCGAQFIASLTVNE